MTFEQFQKSRQWTDDLAASCPDDMIPGAKGWLYANSHLWIEDTSTWSAGAPGFGQGKWYTRIGNQEDQSDAIEVCERPLFKFAESEGLVAG